MVRELFGTDGIRGTANTHPMTPEVALQLGKVIARHFRNGKKPKVVIGKDTRLSGYLFENALTAGLVSAGATVYLVGPMPTPAVAHITRSFAADAGIMITASHNPAAHNGIKIFNSEGFKLPDDEEELIEKEILENIETRGIDTSEEQIGKAIRIDDARGRYIEFAKSSIRSKSLKGLKILLDCANGAAYHITPVIFKELGAEVITLNNQPDGLNINKECGATYPEVIAAGVKEHQCDVGIALDGDADRLIMVDEEGKEVNGDHLLAIIALEMKKEGKLKGNAIVGTQYTNMGLDEAMATAGIEVIRVSNGDRYILEELRKKKLNLGGEQSGHIIIFDHATTGDGTIAALHILKMLTTTGKKLSELATCMQSWPQETRSITVTEKRPLESLARVAGAITDAERHLGDDGRLLVRYSGTEQKARIMVEAKDSSLIPQLIAKIEEAFREEGL
jgi:phosphoglucosamine mutase